MQPRGGEARGSGLQLRPQVAPRHPGERRCMLPEKRLFSRSNLATAMRSALSASLLLVGAYGTSAEDEKRAVIHATVMSVHDRLPPYEVRNIIVEENYTFRLVGGAKVEEEWGVRPVANEFGRLDIGGFSGAQNSALGVGGEHVAWKVLGPHRLQRISEGKQFIEVLDFEIREPRECRLQAKYLLQRGKTAMIARRQDNGQFAEFSINRITSATCSIQ